MKSFGWNLDSKGLESLQEETAEILLSLCLLLVHKEEVISEVSRSCPTLCDPVDYSLPGSSVQEIFQVRVLEWVAISFSRESSWPRDRTQVSCIVGRHFTIWATREILIEIRNRHVPINKPGRELLQEINFARTLIMGLPASRPMSK